MLMALLAVVCYGVAVNIVAPLTQRYGSLPVMARVVGLAVDLDAAVRDREHPGSPRSPGRRSWPSLVLGVLGTGVAFVLMGQLIARVGARASFAIYLTPVVALILGAVFRDEVIHVLSVVGIALVIAGALLASRKERDA